MKNNNFFKFDKYYIYIESPNNYYKFDTNEGFSITKIIDLGGSRTYISGQVDRVVFNLPLEKLDQHIDHLLKFREIL